MRVLLAEDQTKVAAHLARGLREAGYAVDVAHDGDEALWLAGNHPYDAMVLDVMMPGIFLARKSLNPVQQLNRQLAAIGLANLGERMTDIDADPELQRLATQVNGLLDRVENGYERLSSYSTTVAHELRTPIMLMRLQIERARQHIEPGLAEELQEELARLGNYIERTLLSASAEQGKFEITPEDFDLAASIRDLAEGHILLAGESGRIIRLDAPSPLFVHSDLSAFRHIFDNLVVNALRHGHDDVAIRSRRRGDHAVLLIVNSVHPRRVPANAGTGAGVGLRLISALVHALPGARYQSHDGTGFYAAKLPLPVAASTPVEIRGSVLPVSLVE